jgi:hypothetical protein
MQLSLTMLQKRSVVIKTLDGSYSGVVDWTEERGVWITLASSQPSPPGAPNQLNLKLFFPFNQMLWLAVAGQ